MKFSDFRAIIDSLKPDLLCQVYRRNRRCIRVKNEAVAVARLSAVFEKAIEISNRHGFQAMSVRDLSGATDISMGGLYSYIESKDTLLDMILEFGRSAVDRVLDDVPADVVRADERLRWLLRSHLYLSEALLPWFSFCYMESRHFRREARERSFEAELATEQRFVRCIEQGQEEKLFGVHNPALGGSLIMPLLQDWYLKRWKYRRRGVDVEAYAEYVIEFVEAALARPASG
jgi:TetR/AcrR family transcriptional regulator, cholesterol catabolism regulator